MKLLPYFTVALIVSTPVLAEDTRQLDAHEHGVGELNIAFEGAQIAMEFHAPGADIVGFEYAPTSDDDRNAVDAALAVLESPLKLFELPKAAQCEVLSASAELEAEDDHHDEDKQHDEDEHHDHDDEAHEEDDHDEHAEAAGHAEFHAEYLLTCAHPDAIDAITFAYFQAFPNAREVHVQAVTATGAHAFEVSNDMPRLDLGGLF